MHALLLFQLLIVHPDGAEPVDFDSRRWRTAVSRPASAVAVEDLSQSHVAIVGSFDENPWIRMLAPRELEDWYERPGHLVQVVRPNPLNGDYRMYLIIGDLDGAVPRRRADVHVRRDGRTVLLGFYRDDGELETRTFELADTPQLVTKDFRFFVHGFALPDEELRRFERDGERVDVHVYRNLEEKGLITDDTRSAHEEDGEFHIVLGFDERPARLLAETGDAPILVKRGRAALEVYDTDTVNRLAETARRLSLTSDPPDVSALMDDEQFERASPYVSEAVAVSYARGKKSAEHARSSSPAPPDRFLRGITYAHEGYQIHNGYLSARSDSSLEKLKNLGIDAIAVVPYTFMRDPKEIGALEVPRRAGSETDEDVVHVIRKAKSLGMTVLLKPQIWIRRSWPGDIEVENDEEERRFFRDYGRWMRHYALMAEAERVPLFAIGTELAKLTSGRRARWQRLIEDVRHLYSGKLVYAANWGEEVRRVDFWDLLDYIGVDFYYPLSFEDHPSNEELQKGFASALEEIRALHERYEKPVLLTEIGYASTKGPWKKPHASDRELEIALQDQARAYEVAFAGLADETDWIRGMFWWKWPTDLSRGGADDRGFTPNGKPAEDVLRRWYGSPLQ